MTPEEGKFLAQLVHRGFCSKDAITAALAARAEGEGIVALLERRQLLPSGESERLFETEVGEAPKLTRYEILRKLGAGLTALVFEARDRKSHERVALKILRDELHRRPGAVRAFVQEGEQLCKLEHEALVQGLRVAKDRGQIFLAMECVDGENLEDLPLRGETLDEADCFDLIRQVASVLSYLREQGLVHRDVKPGNLIREPGGRIVMIDLGFAAKVGELTDSERTVGTVQYIAPEQAKGSGELDSRADIYSLGATVFHLATGTPPFLEENGVSVLEQQVHRELSSERLVAAGLSPMLHYFVEKMMAKDREIRYADPDELLRDLEEKAPNPGSSRAGTGSTAGAQMPRKRRASTRARLRNAKRRGRR